MFEYFKRNGFLFNISGLEYEPIDTDKMFELIRRLRSTVELLSAMAVSYTHLKEQIALPDPEVAFADDS